MKYSGSAARASRKTFYCIGKSTDDPKQSARRPQAGANAPGIDVDRTRTLEGSRHLPREPKMSTTAQPTMARSKRIVLIAHDNRKDDLLEWARYNRGTLAKHELYGTGTTGALVSSELGLPVSTFLSGPLGGDQQVGAGLAEGRLDIVIFFWDPLEPQPHDVDVKALLRIAVVYNCPIACNRATADFLLSSPLMDRTYAPEPSGADVSRES